MDFGRLITAMVTPFDHEGNIDWTVAEQLIEYLIVQQKTDSIVVAERREKRQPYHKTRRLSYLSLL